MNEEQSKQLVNALSAGSLFIHSSIELLRKQLVGELEKIELELAKIKMRITSDVI